jgi:hypothetical protein
MFKHFYRVGEALNVLDMKSMQIKLIGIRITPFAIVSAAMIVIVAGEKKKGRMCADMPRLQLLRIMGYLKGLYSHGYSGASDVRTGLAKPTSN